MRSGLLFSVVVVHFVLFSLRGTTEQPDPPTGVALLKREAYVLEPVVKSPLGRGFLAATADLPSIAPRVLFADESKRVYLSEEAAKSLDEAARGKLTRQPADESFYYTTRYGSPLAYARPLDLLGQAGVTNPSGLKILDFGYGTIGHLRMLASQGADVTGVDVDPLLAALYSRPEDQGIVTTRQGSQGRIRLIDGRFPVDPSVKAAVGGGYDLVIAKNTLKNGFVHPERPVDKRRLLNLDVDDATFVKTLHEILKPGGWVMIYNICPAPSPPDKPYKHWADGRNPFPRPVWEAAGFQVLKYNEDDSQTIRTLAHALRWDTGEQPMDLENDLFAHYSLMRKMSPSR
jgi:hypothetical protein